MSAKNEFSAKKCKCKKLFVVHYENFQFFVLKSKTQNLIHFILKKNFFHVYKFWGFFCAKMGLFRPELQMNHWWLIESPLWLLCLFVPKYLEGSRFFVSL